MFTFTYFSTCPMPSCFCTDILFTNNFFFLFYLFFIFLFIYLFIFYLIAIRRDRGVSTEPMKHLNGSVSGRSVCSIKHPIAGKDKLTPQPGLLDPLISQISLFFLISWFLLLMFGIFKIHMHYFCCVYIKCYFFLWKAR